MHARTKNADVIFVLGLVLCHENLYTITIVRGVSYYYRKRDADSFFLFFVYNVIVVRCGIQLWHARYH